MSARGRRAGYLLVVLALLLSVMAVPATAEDPDSTSGAPPSELAYPPEVAVSDSGSYIVVMAEDPLIVTEGRDGLERGPARAKQRRLRAAHDRALREVGASTDDKLNDYTVALNGFSALISHEEAEALQARKDVALVMPDELQQVQTDSSPQYLGLTGPGGAHRQSVTGEGVIVGVIDTGIWPEHPSFADDGSYSPVDHDVPCEFGNTDHNPADVVFDCNGKLLGARQSMATYRALTGAEDFEFDSARDDNGHGTHTASTAAGNANVQASIYGRDLGMVSGIAPRARVIAYKGLGYLGGYTSDLAGAIDQAVADGVEVINYSVGGGASLISATDLAYLFAADAGVLVATSAGNSGPGAGTVGSPGSVPWITTVGANTQSRSFAGEVVLGDGQRFTGVSITPPLASAPLVDGQTAGSELCLADALDRDMVEGAIVLCGRGQIGRVAKGQNVMDAGGVGMIMYEQSDTGSLFSDTHVVPAVHVDLTPGMAIREYIKDADSPTAELIDRGTTTWPSAPSMTEFSSRGANRVAPDIIKPDITAPGIQILAGHTPMPDSGVTGELFQAIAGTSMSSPHIAGVFALIKQQHPDWSPAMARSAIMTTANPNVRDNDRTSLATPFGQGSGEVQPGSPSRRGTAFQPGLVYDAGFNDYLGFLCDAAPQVFVNAEATCTTLANAGFATTATDLNYPSIGVAELAGSQTVTRTVTSVAPGRRTFRPTVEAPAGYEVTVSPASLTLQQGQSGTYEVTITNRSAPVGEWRFGSLTFRDNTGQYAARSPIAVKGALFRAPGEITGSGVTGSASFDLSFGYTGSYEAAAHGLEPAVVISDNVVQDPDQVFDPDDGYSNLHEFELEGAAHLRLRMPPEATHPDADIDLFVYDPSGQLVASSTRPGTEEEIDIPLPADGTWKVYVHGWAAPGGAVAYDLFSWVLSATPGGNLVIDSAPDEAVTGASGTVEVSWTGASLDEWHVGAVSHTGSGGLMGLTMVEVDNR
jgi:subtilisin family serine protease